MTDQERDALELEISQLIEPNATRALVANAEGRSPLGAWFFGFKGLEDYGINSRAWTRDENASAMLLDMMPEPNLWLECAAPHKFWMCHADIMEPEPTTPNAPYSLGSDPDRKTAIALAALQWLKARTR